MDEATFWALLERTRAHGPDQPAALHAALVAMDPDEIVAFDRHLHVALRLLHTWDLWAVAFIVQGGCGDDAFEYVRAGIVAEGRATVELAAGDPVAWGMRLDPGSDGARELEDLLYVAALAHEARTGTPLPHHGLAPLGEPAGEAWDEDELGRRHPELAARFGWDDEPGDGAWLFEGQDELMEVLEPHFAARWEAALAAGDRVGRGAAAAADPMLAGVAGAVAGHACFQLGDAEGALVRLLPVLEDPARRDGPRLVLGDLCGAAYAAGMSAFLLGDVGTARRVLGEAVADETARGAEVPEHVRRGLAQLDLAEGDVEAAAANLGDAVADRVLLAKGRALAGDASASDGLDELADALADEVASGRTDPRTGAGLWAVLGETWVALGDGDGARRAADAGQALVGGDPTGPAPATDVALVAAQAERLAGRPEAAAPLLDAVAAAALATGAAWTLAAVERERARLAAAQGRAQEAAQRWAAAAHGFDAAGYTAEAAACRVEADAGP